MRLAMRHDVAIIGGGRWGRVILSVLATSDLPVDHITLVTTHNTALTQNVVSRLTSNHPIRIVSELSDRPSVTIIANAARSHGETARNLIARGAHLLIEKPVVLTLPEARQLLSLARAARTILLAGLSYRFCSYLRNFERRIAPVRPLTGFDLRWTDPVGEIRYGEQITYDATINVADDVMPHIWAILSVLFPQDVFSVKSCRMARGGKSATFTLSAGGMKGAVTLERDSDRRRRTIQLSAPASLDFSVEPGTMAIGAEIMTADAEWVNSPGPLARQLRYFLECVEQGKTAGDDDTALLESVRLAESASALFNARVPVGG
jgi:predicted dehydrogenase